MRKENQATDNLKCVVFGLGQVGREVCAQLVKKRIEIVGVYTRNSHQGEALTKVIETSNCPNITVQRSDEFSSDRCKADIAIFCTTSLIGDLRKEASDCLRNGINVLTIAEDALYPWHHAPEISEELDTIAREGGATLAATGVNDIAMTQLPVMVAGFSQDIHKVSIECTGNFGKFGKETLEGLPVNLTEQQFKEYLDNEEAHQQASISEQSLDAIVAMMRLKKNGEAQVRVTATWAQQDTFVEPLQITLPRGRSSGIQETASCNTQQEIEIEVTLIGKIFDPSDCEYVQVQVDGASDMQLRLSPLPGIEVTAAAVVNRIQDVISAEAGYLTAEKLPSVRYSTLI